QFCSLPRALCFSFSSHGVHRDLHSFPTRRSSDLATLDVVLVARRSFPLDLIDFVRARLDQGPASYLTRTLALRGENLQRRIAVVDRKSTRLNSSHDQISYAVFCLKKKKNKKTKHN